MKGLGLTDSTIKTYLCILESFFKHTRKVRNFTYQEISDYLDYLIVVKNNKARSRNLVAKIIRFYCREFEGREIEIKKAKEDKPIPKICEDKDFSKILSVTPNIKHKLCLQLMRYSGLRRWEVIRIMKILSVRVPKKSLLRTLAVAMRLEVSFIGQLFYRRSFRRTRSPQLQLL